MTTWYIDPTVSGTGSGTIGNPYRSTRSVVPANGDTIAIKTGATLREQIAVTAIAATTLTITSYGTGALPIICGSDVVTDWQPSGYPGVYMWKLGAATGGNISQNGSPMTCVFFDTDFATTAPTILDGYYCWDHINFIYYINPTFGKVKDVTFEVSTKLWGIFSTAAFAGLTITGVEFRGQSRNSIDLQNRGAVIAQDCVFRQVGGDKSTGFYVGDGYQVSTGCDGSICRRCYFYDMFDTAITFQLYTNGQTLDNCQAYGNFAYRTGFYAYDASIVGAVTGCTLTNVYFHDNYAEDAGYAFRPVTVTGLGMHFGGPQATSTLTNLFCHDSTFVNCRWGLKDDTGGATVSGIEFQRCSVVTNKSPTNGRGIYTNGTALYSDNLIQGYTYGVGVTGSVAGSYTCQVLQHYFVDCDTAVYSDATAGTHTLQLRNSTILPRTRFYAGTAGVTLDMSTTNRVRGGIIQGSSAAVTALAAGTRVDLPARYV